MAKEADPFGDFLKALGDMIESLPVKYTDKVVQALDDYESYLVEIDQAEGWPEYDELKEFFERVTNSLPDRGLVG